MNLSIFPIFLVLLEIAIYLSNDAYLPALPQITKDLSITDDQARLTLALCFLGAASFHLFAGPLSDQTGRRPVLLWGGLCFAIATAICALTSDIYLFYIMRFIQGASVCTTVTAGYATIHELLEQKKAIHTLSWMNGITVLAPAFGPLLGAMVLLIGDWRLIFWILFVFGTIAIIALHRYMPESCPIEKRHPIILKRIIKNYYSIIKNPVFSLNTLVFSCMFGGMCAWITAGPFLIIDEFKETVIQFGIYQVLIFGLFIIGTIAIRYAMSVLPTRIISLIGVSLAFIASVSAMVFAALLPESLLPLIICLMLFAGGSGFALPAINRTAIEASVEPMGATVAMFFTGMSLFAALGSFLVNIFYDNSIASVAIIVLFFGLLAIILKAIILLKYSPIQGRPSKT